ncbi:uncharacterized protein [Miscanthus floridulus]|uniref:uncharacterized protein n=1 Tax=Miscanthus floridulus TaxID=154761 RepID=UPI003459DE7B
MSTDLFDTQKHPYEPLCAMRNKLSVLARTVQYNTEGVTNYGEAASVKMFDANILTWLPYDEDEDNELVPPVKFWFDSGCSDETAAIPLGKTSTQEQRSTNTIVEDDHVDDDTQTVDSLTQQTIDDTSFKSLEPIQPNVEKDVGTSSAIPSPQLESLLEKALNSPTLSYSFNFEEYIDKSEISSSVISSQETLSEKTKNRLKDMLPMLVRNIADLVQDVDPMRKIFLAIKDNLTPNLVEALIPISNIDDQAPKVKKAQRNLIDHEALMAKKNSNKQKAKKLAQLIDNLKNSSSKIKPELNQLRVRRVELEKELESVKAIIEHHESNLTQIPNAIKQNKQEILTKVREGKAIRNSHESIHGSAEEDKQQIAEVDTIRLKAL